MTATSGFTKFGNTIAVMAFDYDNDGLLDVMFGNYFKPVNLLDLKTTHVLPNDLDNAVNGGGVTLWHNLGNGRFEDGQKKPGSANTPAGRSILDMAILITMACRTSTWRAITVPIASSFNNGDGTFGMPPRNPSASIRAKE